MKQIDDFLKDMVKNHQTPSVQYAFFDTNKVVYKLEYGFKNIQLKEHVDPDTMYHLYSVTKTFTALSVLQLVQTGIIELNKPVALYVSEFPYPEEITVEQVLNHTSGIPNPLPLRWIHLAEEHTGFERDKFFDAVFKAHPKLKFKPGTAFTYSNLGYVLLGQLIEKVSGLSFEEYVKRNIIERCGVDHSGLRFEIIPSNHAVGYHKWASLSNILLGFLINKKQYMIERVGRWKPFRFFYNNGIAYGGMLGSSKGLILYAQSLLKRNSVLLDDQHKQILFRENFVRKKSTGMAMSWFTGSLEGNTYFAHAGGGGGYYVEVRIYPDLDAGSVILFNRSGMKDERILDKTDRYLLQEDSRWRKNT